MTTGALGAERTGEETTSRPGWALRMFRFPIPRPDADLRPPGACRRATVSLRGILVMPRKLTPRHHVRPAGTGRPQGPPLRRYVEERKPQPPDIAPITRNGSAPVATGSGSGSSGGSWEMSRSEA